MPADRPSATSIVVALPQPRLRCRVYAREQEARHPVAAEEHQDGMMTIDQAAPSENLKSMNVSAPHDQRRRAEGAAGRWQTPAAARTSRPRYTTYASVTTCQDTRTTVRGLCPPRAGNQEQLAVSRRLLMTMSSSRPLRVWPVPFSGALAGLLFFALPAVSAAAAMIGLIGGLVSALAVIVWWLVFSRAPWPERLGIIALGALAIFVTYRLVDASIAGGAMGFMLTFFSLPAMAAAVGAAVYLTRHAPASTRRASLVIGLAMACGFLTMLRTDGMLDGRPQLKWRWTPTAEEMLLARAEEALPAAPVAAGSCTCNARAGARARSECGHACAGHGTRSRSHRDARRVARVPRSVA
jgi:hypothetical protein